MFNINMNSKGALDTNSFFNQTSQSMNGSPGSNMGQNSYSQSGYDMNANQRPLGDVPGSAIIQGASARSRSASVVQQPQINPYGQNPQGMQMDMNQNSYSQSQQMDMNQNSYSQSQQMGMNQNPYGQPQSQQMGMNQNPYGQPQSQQMNQQMGMNQYATRTANRPAPTGVILKKGQKVSLADMCQNLSIVDVGIGWDLNQYGANYDLDVEAFLVDDHNHVIGDDWFVFYNQPTSPDGSVSLVAQSDNGQGSGDDEIIQINLNRVNPAVQRIVFIVTINDAKIYGYDFSNVQNAYARVVDHNTGKELCRFQLTEAYRGVCSMMVGELYRHNGQWKFNPIGNGTQDDLEGLCIRYGVNVAG